MKTVTRTGSWRTLWLQKSPRGTNEVLRRLANGCWRNAVEHSSVSETEPTRCSCRCCWDTMYNRAFQSSQRVKTLIEFLKTRRYALLLPGRVSHVETLFMSWKVKIFVVFSSVHGDQHFDGVQLFYKCAEFQFTHKTTTPESVKFYILQKVYLRAERCGVLNRSSISLWLKTTWARWGVSTGGGEATELMSKLTKKKV